MERLVDCKAPALPRGTVFRFNGSYPYEHSVDFMLVLDQSWDRPLAIMVATGYSAGHIVAYLPVECLSAGTLMLSTEWLLANWSKWICPECPIEDVYYLEHYPAPRDPMRRNDQTGQDSAGTEVSRMRKS